jgi:putative membrane protein
MRDMHVVAIAAAVIAAVIHVWFFLMESVWFLRESVWRRFGISSDADARIVRSWAYNQGFYNLFLAIGVAAGLTLVSAGDPAVGRPIVLFACGSMIAAAVVLVTHSPQLLRAGLIQGIPPLVAVLGIVFLS